MKAKDLVRGDIFLLDNGFSVIAVDNYDNDSKYIFCANILAFYFVEIQQKGIYGVSDSGYEHYNPDKEITFIGNFLKEEVEWN